MGTEDEWRLIKSPLNYTGNKFQLLSKLQSLFPTRVQTFYDLCSGGGDVGANMTWADKVVCVDVQSDVISLLKRLKEIPGVEFVKMIDNIIESYGLSNSALYGYAPFLIGEQKGLAAYNKESFKVLREDYNKLREEPPSLEKSLLFFALIVFSFNNQIRFNSDGDFNIAVGKYDLNSRQRSKLEGFSDRLKKIDISFVNSSYEDVIESREMRPNDFIYIDPPYLITTATYNQGWGEEEENRLLEFLTRMDKDGVRFALSNVTVHKGRRNELLIEWAKRFRVRDLYFNYDNSSYQGKNTDEKTVEVLIRNY
jgi:DNA adenine methylase